MTVNELRVDNYILYKSPFGNREEKIGQMKRGDFSSFDERLYNPIPLTPEWLERCGFEFAPSVGYYVYELPNKPQGIDSIKVGSGVFLHQLQNLYFALTGEELQIKMP